MKRKKFTEEQIIKALKRIEAGEQAKAVCRELGVHEQTYYNWKKKYSGMEVDQLREFKMLQDENNRLKKIVADQALNIDVLKAVNAKKW
jgi:putative transposase